MDRRRLWHNAYTASLASAQRNAKGQPLVSRKYSGYGWKPKIAIELPRRKLKNMQQRLDG